MRKIAVTAWLLVLLTTIIALFWHNEWVYSLPTPVPKNFRAVNPGTVIDVTNKLPFKTDQPVLLHFYNPDCPCSRFNIPHFRSLVNKYGDKIRFVIVAVTRKKITASEISNRFDLNVPVLIDSTLAAECGVYSTPQAAIIDTGKRL